MSELQVTGGYEPNDPVVMSREEYHSALERARSEAKEDTMSEQDKRAEEVWWEAFDEADCQADGDCNKAIAIIAAALAQARREGVEAMRDELMRLYPTMALENEFYQVAARLLAKGGTDG